MDKILIINNDDDTMSLLKTWFERRAYKVKYTSSGDNIPQLIKEFEPKVVLIDVLQKSAAAEIKKNEETCDVPVILMTGYTSRHTPLDVMVDDVIEKPFSPALLEKKIERLIN